MLTRLQRFNDTLVLVSLTLNMIMDRKFSFCYKEEINLNRIKKKSKRQPILNPFAFIRNVCCFFLGGGG